LIQVGHQDSKHDPPVDQDRGALGNRLARDDQLAAAVDHVADALFHARRARGWTDVVDIGTQCRDVAVCDVDISGRRVDFGTVRRRSSPRVRVRDNHQRQGRDAGQQHSSSGRQGSGLMSMHGAPEFFSAYRKRTLGCGR
jgi:hypothetical protein